MQISHVGAATSSESPSVEPNAAEDNTTAQAGEPDGVDLVGDMRERLLEASLSFNTQYLQLQSRFQNESRQYTLVSNVLKTRYDMDKNAIGNIR